MLNKYEIIGRLGKDPEVRHLNGGNVVAKITVATSEKYKDGNKQESTEWHNVEIWGKLAEIAEKYLKKGSLVRLSGKHKTDVWEKEGVKQYSSKLLANELLMLDTRQASSQPATQTNQPTQDSISDSGDDDLPF